MTRYLSIVLALAYMPIAYSRPAVETVPRADFNAKMREWRKATNPPEPMIVIGNDLKPGNLPGDVLLWERYSGQALAKGDLFVFAYRGSDTCREIGTVGQTYVKTLAGTQVNLNAIKGIVRRVVRVVD